MISRSVDFRPGFSLQGFCVLYFILSIFLTKDVLECIVSTTYLIGCCNCTLINLVLKTIVLIFNTTHKIGRCKYWYWLERYNLWCISWIAFHCKYYITQLFFSREICTYSNFFFFFFFNILFSYALFLMFPLFDFCVPLKHGFLELFLF